MKTFIILGMHRSATSLAAQGLYRSGVWIGQYLIAANETNKYGHWEDIDFIHMNDKILDAAGGSWNNPPVDANICAVGYDMRKELNDFINMKKREPFWGWKDPRTSLTIRCYMPYLINPHFIVCYRNVNAVAESLNKRDNMPIEEGKQLAMVYNNRIRKFMDEWQI